MLLDVFFIKLMSNYGGIGIGIGVTILTAILIYILQKIVKLNIPIIGQYISDIADIVENNK